MRKVLILVLIAFTTFIFSKNRTQSDAVGIATEFFNSASSGMRKAPFISSSLHLAYQHKIVGAVPDINNLGYYFVFNKGEDGGFVIISGNDRAKTILGYADAGSFDVNNLPDGMKYWLDGFVDELKSLENTTESDSLSSSRESSTPLQKVNNSTNAVAPLLGNIKWNQGAPYNNLCPLIPPQNTMRSATGCVATAMAQVMMYYQWPMRGSGSNNYISSTNQIPLTVDFSATQYDWANMTTTYGSASTSIQKTAVATLMYHCGVSVNMNYSQSSGAYATDMGKALINNFGYDQNIQIYNRNFYNRIEWDGMIKAELNAARPVLYGGTSATAGHRFVCDGYDANGLFHINWGWSGISNGYFVLSALNPSDQGIGGGSGGYNKDQSIVIGVQKPNANSVPAYIISSNRTMTSSVASTVRTAPVTISFPEIYNKGINTFTGNTGLALYNGVSQVQIIKTNAVSTKEPKFGWTTWTMTDVSIPTRVANGNYKLYAIYKASTETDWQIIRGKVGTANYLDVVVSTNGVAYTTPTSASPALSLSSINVTGNLYQGKRGRFALTIANSGDEFNSKIGLKLTLATNSATSVTFTKDANIINGETKTYYFNDTVSLAPGSYNLTALYDPTNSGSTTLSTLGNAQTLNVFTVPTDTALLTLDSIISFPNSNAVGKSNAVLTANIKNNSGYYDKKLIAYVYPYSGGSYLTYIGYQTAVIDANEKQTVTFSGPIDLTVNTRYKIAIYWQNTNKQWVRITPTNSSYLYFNLINDDLTPAAMVNPKLTNRTLEVYPSLASDKIWLNSETLVQAINVFDFTGRLVLTKQPKTSGLIELNVEGLKAGAYIIRINTINNLETYKFIKM